MDLVFIGPPSFATRFFCFAGTIRTSQVRLLMILDLLASLFACACASAP